MIGIYRLMEDTYNVIARRQLRGYLAQSSNITERKLGKQWTDFLPMISFKQLLFDFTIPGTLINSIFIMSIFILSLAKTWQ